MRKSKYFILITTALMSFSMACTKSNPPAAVIEYQAVCTEANKGKTIAVQGFLSAGDKTPCVLLPAAVIKRNCAFKLMDKVNITGKEIIVYLVEGKENNRAETPDAGQPESNKTSKVFARNEIKIHLDDGTLVAPQENIATPVTVTGEVGLTGDGNDQICTINAGKVEKR